MRKAFRFMAFCLLLPLTGIGLAQSTNSGDIRGSVTDSTGALIPDTTVTVVNVDTGVAKSYVTNQDGLYDTGSIVAGNYKITFKRQGFGELVRGPITLEVGFSTINATLNVGSTTEQVIVDTDVALLTTETGEQKTTLAAKEMSQLPQTGQDWENFTILLPGTSGTAMGSQGSSNPGQVVSANGNLPYSNVLADGASSTLSHSQNADVSVFETVAELQVSTSAFSAQYGVGGIQFNQISKGGTNNFHGSAYDYWQNDLLNARSYTFPGNDPQAVPLLRYNNFGGSVGGPILKKKMFFFFNYDRVVNHGGANTGTNTIPTDAVMSGDFTGFPTLFDPTTQTIVNGVPVRKSFADEYGNGNKIPAALIDKVSAAIQSYYPTQANHPSFGKFVPGVLQPTGVIENNWYTSIANSSPTMKYFGRLDYDITPNNRLTMSDTQRDVPAFYPSAVECPINCQSGDVDSNNAQVTDVWNLNSNTINEARMGFTSQLNFFADQTIGKGYPAKLGWQFAQADSFPSATVNSAYYGLGHSSNAVYKEMVFDPSDVVTMVRGKHVLHFGGEFLMYRDDSTAWGNLNAGSMNFSGQYTQAWTNGAPDPTTGNSYADFLLGDMQSWSASVNPEYGARLKSPQVFVQDDFKVRPNLTLNLGLRYQIQHGWNEVKNNESIYDPTVLNPATQTPGAIWYAGTAANGRKSLQANIFNTFLPRFGFSWLPKSNTTLRGGFGVFAYNWSLDTYGNGMGGAHTSSGNDTDQSNGVTSIGQLGGSGSNLPYIAPTTDPAAQNGQDVNYSQFHTPLPKIYQWNLSVQREVGTNLVAEVSYVASHGSNLNFPVDINQVPVALLSANDSGDRPNPNFHAINGSTNNAISNYNSLQATINKRMTSGLSFAVNYTWSHFLDDQDSSGWGSRAGQQNYQNSYKPSLNYANSNFDQRHALKGNVVYELPFGQGKQFLNHNQLLDGIIGGWQASGTVILLSGNPFTVFANDNTSFAQAGSLFPNSTGVSPKPLHRSINEWYNPAAFSQPAPGTFGNVGRNSVTGPGINQVNLSAGKTFSLLEGIKLQIRADATNAFNHASFGVPNQYLSIPSGAPSGTTSFDGANTNITWVTVGARTMQLGAHLTF
jgi:hypothetical protein